MVDIKNLLACSKIGFWIMKGFQKSTSSSPKAFFYIIIPWRSIGLYLILPEMKTAFQIFPISLEAVLIDVL